MITIEQLQTDFYTNKQTHHTFLVITSSTGQKMYILPT